MSNMLLKTYLGLKYDVKHFFSSEKGESNIVAIILVIIVVIAVVAFFGDKLMALVEKIFDKINGNVDNFNPGASGTTTTTN